MTFIMIMNFGAEAVHKSVDYHTSQGEKIGVLKIRLTLPSFMDAFFTTLPSTVMALAVLDDTKESSSLGEPLYQDVVITLLETHSADLLPLTLPKVIGGRDGLSSKEFTPAMIKAIYDELGKPKSKNHFTSRLDRDPHG